MNFWSCIAVLGVSLLLYWAWFQWLQYKIYKED